MFARNVTKDIVPLVIWRVTVRLIGVWVIKRPGSAPIVTRFTSVCPRTVCTCARTIRAVSALIVGNASADLGYFKVTSVHTPGRSPSGVRSVVNHSRINLTSVRMCRHTAQINRMFVGDVGKRSRWRVIFINMRSRRVCADRGYTESTPEVTEPW